MTYGVATVNPYDMTSAESVRQSFSPSALTSPSRGFTEKTLTPPDSEVSAREKTHN